MSKLIATMMLLGLCKNILSSVKHFYFRGVFSGPEVLDKWIFWPITGVRWNNRESPKSLKVHPLMSLNIGMNFCGYPSVVVEIFLHDSPKSYCHRYRRTLFQQVAAQTLFVFSLTLFFLLAMFQSKDIGIQMHEELVKVTNELYTVSYSLSPADLLIIELI